MPCTLKLLGLTQLKVIEHKIRSLYNSTVFLWLVSVFLHIFSFFLWHNWWVLCLAILFHVSPFPCCLASKKLLRSALLHLRPVRSRVILWIFNGIFFPYFKLFSGKFPAVFLLYVILRTHRRKNFKSLLPYVVFLKLSLCAAFHEDAIVKAIVFRQRVSFSFLRKCMWMQLTFHAWNVFLKDQWTQLPKMYSNVSIFLKYPGNK